MECKDSGEFAHRETTEYEQTETFNDELVMAERGEENYIHMKSKDDEYEHMESHMPRKEREQQAREEQERMAQEAQAKLAEERAERMRIIEEISLERERLISEGEDPDDPKFEGRYANQRAPHFPARLTLLLAPQQLRAAPGAGGDQVVRGDGCQGQNLVRAGPPRQPGHRPRRRAVPGQVRHERGSAGAGAGTGPPLTHAFAPGSFARAGTPCRPTTTPTTFST